MTQFTIGVGLKELKGNHDSETPLNAFRAAFARTIVELDVPRPDGVEKWALSKRPGTSGSRHARTIIAYYAALWRTIAPENKPLPSPLVIDSPNQGAQDKTHLQQLLTSIASEAPQGAQVILAHEERPSVFAADKVFEFSNKFPLLEQAKFAELSPQVFWYVEEARRALAGISMEDHSELVDDGSEDAEDNV